MQESRDLDFKRDAIARDDKARREFLKDITAFANTAGGHLVIGMDEASGVAAGLCGITSPPADLVEGVERTVTASAKIGASSPFAVMVSFTGGAGSVILSDPYHPGWGAEAT